MIEHDYSHGKPITARNEALRAIERTDYTFRKYLEKVDGESLGEGRVQAVAAMLLALRSTFGLEVYQRGQRLLDALLILEGDYERVDCGANRAGGSHG